MCRWELGSHMLQRLTHISDLTTAHLRRQHSAANSFPVPKFPSALNQNTGFRRDLPHSAKLYRNSAAMDVGTVIPLGLLPPAWWLQCLHRRQPLGHAAMARPANGHNVHTASQSSMWVDPQRAGTVGSRQILRAASQHPPTAAAHLPQGASTPFSSGSRTSRYTMAATAIRAPPKWGDPVSPPRAPPYDQQPANLPRFPDHTSPLNGAPLAAAANPGTAVRPSSAAGFTRLPPPNHSDDPHSVVVEGIVRHVTFRAGDSGFTVLKVEVTNQEGPPAPAASTRAKPLRDSADPRRRRQSAPQTGLVTVTGTFQPLNKGQLMRFEGRWMEHSTFGNQLQASRYHIHT